MAINATSVAVKGRVPGEGGTMLFLTAVIDPESIAANAVITSNVLLSNVGGIDLGVKVGDWVQVGQGFVPANGTIMIKAANVVANGVLSIQHSNDGTVTADMANTDLYIQIFKLSNGR